MITELKRTFPTHPFPFSRGHGKEEREANPGRQVRSASSSLRGNMFDQRGRTGCCCIPSLCNWITEMMVIHLDRVQAVAVGTIVTCVICPNESWLC